MVCFLKKNDVDYDDDESVFAEAPPRLRSRFGTS